MPPYWRDATAVRLATRGSPLARRQAEYVAHRLGKAGVTGAELVVVETMGDRRRDVPIGALAGRGAFSAEVDVAVADGRADVAVHSAKDLRSGDEEGLVIAAVPEREDPRDALVGRALDELAPGSLVATGAVRRRAQLAWYQPDLVFTELRGNIGTRLEKVPPGGAVVVALAALHRLGLAEAIAEVLDPSIVLPQVGQGAIALRCRSDDDQLRELLAMIDDVGAHTELRAERAFLAAIGGGCDAPVGALAHASGSARSVSIEGIVASPDGHVVIRERHAGEDPERVGAELARRLLEEDGAASLLGER